MITVEAEATMWGTVQHCETDHAVLASCLYETALKYGLEPDAGQHHNGMHYVDFYADEATFNLIYHEAEEKAVEESITVITSSHWVAA